MDRDTGCGHDGTVGRLAVVLTLSCVACGRIGFEGLASGAIDGSGATGDANTTACGSLNSDTSCGNCGTSCACLNGACTGPFTCNSGYAHCTGPATNGCETSLSSDATCGDCATVCASDHTCANQVCTACASGFADCDGLASNGCETDLLHDRNNCGGCGPPYACSGPTVCRDGQCY